MMKKTTLFALFFVIGQSVFAQNKLTVFSEIGEQFYVILNGIRQNVNPETNVQVDGLSADYYSVKIIFNNKDLADIDRNILNVTGEGCKPCDVAYKIKYDKKGNPVLRSYSFSQITTAPEVSDITVVHYNTVPMPMPVIGVQVTETTTYHQDGGENVNVGMNIGGINMDVNVNDGSYGSTTTTTTTTTTMSSSSNVNVVESRGCYPMSSSNFSSLMSTLNGKSWDEEKMSIAKQSSNANCFSADQVKQIMGTFQWEEAKLDFAKYAYKNCYDKNNYFKVNDEFEWSDNVEELNNYIGGQ